jgi:hypothetical protein
MSFPRLALLLVLVGVAALAAPGSASAWKYKFQDFFDTSGGAAAASVIKAKKCHGGKLGNYKLVSRVAGFATQTELELEVRATLPVTERRKRLKDVEVEVDASSNFDPMVIAEMTQATADFWSGVSVRWKPGKLKFKHPSLIFSGAQVLAPGKNTVDFKPKPGC